MHHALCLVALLALPSGAPAQVRTSPEPYPVPAAAPLLPVRPYVATPPPVSTPAPAPSPEAPVPAAQLLLRRGELVADGLRAQAKPAGWDLVWDAPPYVTDRDILVPGGFEAAMESFLQGANEAGVRMRAMFYRGNRTVRVWEE